MTNPFDGERGGKQYRDGPLSRATRRRQREDIILVARTRWGKPQARVLSLAEGASWSADPWW